MSDNGYMRKHPNSRFSAGVGVEAGIAAPPRCGLPRQHQGFPPVDQQTAAEAQARQALRRRLELKN